MITVQISNWRLKELVQKYPDLYKKLREVQSDLPEDITKEYASFEGNFNSIDNLPPSLYEFAEFKPIPVMQFQTEFKPIDIKQALQTHQVHLPGNELLYIRKTKVLVDSCTDALQKELEDGWKIIAVCIQASQRRPDYVLGRGFENSENES